MGRIKLMTFESWVTRREWYEYARDHPQYVPHLLVDRSPCADPFFDPFAPTPDVRRPMITGLCRCLKGFQPGDRYVYITRIDPRLYQVLGVNTEDSAPRYYVVAASTVQRVWPSHGAAAESFSPRRYVAMPPETPYPPNLAHHSQPVAAVSREGCVVHDESGRAYAPPHSGEELWRNAYVAYHLRQKDHRLVAAECQIDRHDGRESLQLQPGEAPVVTSALWGDRRMNVMGLSIGDDAADALRALIGAGCS